MTVTNTLVVTCASCSAAFKILASLNFELQPGNFVQVDAEAVRIVFDIEAPDHQSLLYRSSYRDIYELLANRPSQVDVTGTPGIGKSTMLFFFLLLFLKQGKTVAVATRALGSSFLIFQPNGAVELVSERPHAREYVYLLEIGRAHV